MSFAVSQAEIFNYKTNYEAESACVTADTTSPRAGQELRSSYGDARKQYLQEFLTITLQYDYLHTYFGKFLNNS